MFTLPKAAEAAACRRAPRSYYSFDFANVHFIVLDGNSSSTAPGGPMMTWLEAGPAGPNADWLVVLASAARTAGPS